MDKNIISYILNIILFIIAIVTIACSNRQLEIPDDMILIPEGEFIMGSNDAKTIKEKADYQSTKPLFLDEYPERTVFLDTFFIDRFEVTNAQYWISNKRYKYPPGKDNHPAANINWFEADLFCKAYDKRLPTEEEWEKAARGPTGNIYPWGNKFNPAFANIGKTEKKGTTPVGVYENGKSYYGVYDMIGNIGEWTASLYKAYPGSDIKNIEFDEKQRVIRGSSWGGLGHYNLNVYDRASFRRKADPGAKIPDVGFRCAKTP